MEASEGSPPDLERRLQDIRRRTLPAILGRVDAIGRAAAEGASSDELEAGRADAHKLRGLLGTLGLARGSELAAAIETELEAAVEGNGMPGWSERVAAQAGELRAEVESG
jgi:HPt (histidine-containing phosphotransfer) domain-containing protein